jgi:hypothetical protein
MDSSAISTVHLFLHVDVVACQGVGSVRPGAADVSAGLASNLGTSTTELSPGAVGRAVRGRFAGERVGVPREVVNVSEVGEPRRSDGAAKKALASAPVRRPGGTSAVSAIV